jgi:HEAT repeat protein
MLPILPFDLLVPLALGTSILVLTLVTVVFARRLFIKWWSLGGKRATGEIESILLDALAGGTSAESATRWISRGRPARIRAFVAASRAIETTSPQWNEWLLGSGIPRTLASIAVPPPGQRPAPRWKRVAAVVAIGQLRLKEHDALIRAIDDPDLEVAYVAAEAIGRLDTPEGARAFFERIGVQSDLLDSRLASLIEGMTCDVTEVLREALRSKNPTIVYWALSLTGRKKEVEFIELVRPHLSSEDPNVRAAACECVGALKLRLTDTWLAPHIQDEAWYVQCHAVKALGGMQAVWAAEEISALLYSPHWWVRQNAAQALADLGAASESHAERILRSEDKYARNSAVEVLARLGWAEQTVLRVHRTRSPEAMELLERFGTSGGLGYLENALWVIPESAVPMLLGVLEKIGDRATYGRIRAARYRLPPELQELALATADRVKAK